VKDIGGTIKLFRNSNDNKYITV